MQPLSEDQFASIYNADPETGGTMFANRVASFTGTMHYLVADKWKGKAAPTASPWGGVGPLGSISDQRSTETFRSRACFACWAAVPGRIVGMEYVHNVDKLKFPTDLVEQHYRCGWDGVFARIFSHLPSFRELREKKVWKVERWTDKWTLWEFSALARTIRAFTEQPCLISSAAWLYHMFGHEFPPWVLAAAASVNHFGAPKKGQWKVRTLSAHAHTSWHCLTWAEAANFARVLRYVQENGLDISAWHNHPYSPEVGGTDRAFMFAGASTNKPYGRALVFPNDTVPEVKGKLLGKSLASNPALGRSAIQRTRSLLQFVENCADIPLDWSSREHIEVNLSDVLPAYATIRDHFVEQATRDKRLADSYRRKNRMGEPPTAEEREAAMRLMYA